MSGVATSDEDVMKKCKHFYATIRRLQDGFTALEKVRQPILTIKILLSCLIFFKIQCPKPVIAAIHGACVGGGIDLITAADIRYCSEDAWFTVKEVDLGDFFYLRFEKSQVLT